MTSKKERCVGDSVLELGDVGEDMEGEMSGLLELLLDGGRTTGVG